MATRTFADLSPYRRAVSNAQAGTNLLDSLIQGVQGGIQLARLPQTLQDNALAQELQNALTRQKILDLQNPEAALARRLEQELTLKGALNPDLGIQRAPVGLVGETIANPGAITPAQQAALPSNELLAMRDIALQQGGVNPPAVVIPTAPAGLPETPISAFGIQTGLTSNPNVPVQAAEDKLERQIQLANSRVRSAGVQGQFIPDGFGGMVFAQKPTTTGGEVITTRVNTPEGDAVKVASKTSPARALTPNAQTTLLGQASAAGIDPDDPKYLTDGVYDFTKLAIDKGKAVRENKRLDNAAKAAGLTGTTKTSIEALNAAEKQLHFLQDEIEQIASSGSTPGFWDNVIAAGTAAPADGFISGIVQQLAKGVQSDESKLLEGKKSIISSSLTKAISGLAVSKSEASRLGFLPRAGDSFEDLVMKASLVEEYIKNQRAGLAGAPDTVTPTAAPTGGIQIRSIRRKP